MKKLIGILSGLCLFAGMSFGATITNALGHVITTTVTAYGTTTTVTIPNQPAATVRTQTSQPGVQIDTNVTTTVTSVTPRDYGDILIGGYGTGTNAFWIACGVSTNAWVLGGTNP